MIANDRQKIASGDFLRNKLFHFVRRMMKKKIGPIFQRGGAGVWTHLGWRKKKVAGNEEKKRKTSTQFRPSILN